MTVFWYTQEVAHERRLDLMCRAEAARLALQAKGAERDRRIRRALGLRLVGAGLRLMGPNQSQPSTDCA